MKSRETALRLKRFEVDEKARKVADLEYMIGDFEKMANDLDRQIQAEEERTGVRDVAHFAYSTFAKSAAVRRDNLRSSAEELKKKLDAAQKERDEALEQMARASNPEARDESRPRSTNRRRNDRTPALAYR